MAALSFPACMALAAIISFMMEDTSSFGFSELIFAVFCSVAYLWFEVKRDEYADNDSISVASRSRAMGQPVEKILTSAAEEDAKDDDADAADIVRLQAEAQAQEALRTKQLEQQEELAKKEAELKAQEEERIQKELVANAEQEAQEALRLKQIEDARLQAEAEQAARLKEEAESKQRILEEERLLKEMEEAERLEAEAQEATRLQAELEEEARKKAEAEAKRKEEEKTARIEAQEEEELKLQQIEQARAQAEAEQAARLQSEAESKAKAKEEEAARLAEEEKERILAEQELKDKMEDSMVFTAEQLDEFDIEKSNEFSLTLTPVRRRKTLEAAFHGSMGYLANTDAAAKSTMSMRVRVLNETTGRSKDVIVPVTPDLTMEEAIYSNQNVREAGVRKWPKNLAQSVKRKTAKVVCLLLDPNTTNVMHNYSIPDMKETSTEAMHELAKPESDQTVRILLKCERIVQEGETGTEDEVLKMEEHELDRSALFSVTSAGDESIGLEPTPTKEQGTPTTVDAAASEDAENDTTTGSSLKQAHSGDGGISPKGAESVDGDGTQSVSDGSTYSSKSIESKRRRKRELEAKRLSLTSPTAEAKPPVEGDGGGFLSRFFARQEKPENSPSRATQ